MFDPVQMLRPNIRVLQAYSSARDEFKGKARVFLDANESPFSSDLNRYPDGSQPELRSAVAQTKGVLPGQVILGNGSDEIIDLLFRAFCEPQADCVLAFSPTYSMYRVSAGIQDVPYQEIALDQDFQIPSREQWESDVTSAKLVFLCSPNNPTGNLMRRADILAIAKSCKGLVIVDEAYIDFSPESSMNSAIRDYPNLVVLQTFSKAWGLAGVRLGVGMASEAVIECLDRIRPPYNVNSLTAATALSALSRAGAIQEQVTIICEERTRVRKVLDQLPGIGKVYPSDANFLLIEFDEHERVFETLREQGIIVRDRSAQVSRSLRITIGTPEENDLLMAALKGILQPSLTTAL